MSKLQNKIRRRNLWRHNRRGSALLEFVIAVPFLGFLIGLTFFFGWAMMNAQTVRVASRYTAWRTVYGGNPTPTEATVNEECMGGRANPVSVGVNGLSGLPFADYQTLVSSSRPKAVDLADELYKEDGFPEGRSADISAEFPSTVSFFAPYVGGILNHHSVDNPPWGTPASNQGGDLWGQSIKTIYLTDLDTRLTATAIANSLRSLYLARW